VPEIYQDDATPEILAQALINQVNDKEVRARQEREFQAIHDRLRQNTAERAVEAVLPMLVEKGSAARPLGTIARAPEAGT